MALPFSRGKLPSIPLPFGAICVLLIITTFTGGSSRADVESLVFLRPLSILMCGVAFLTLRREHIARRKLLLTGMTAIFAVNLIYTVPMPQVTWASLQGGIDNFAPNSISGWRPMTLVSLNTWSTLASLFTPLAIMLFGFQLCRDDLYRLLVLFLIVGTVSVAFGIFQAIDGDNSALYLYRITNTGSVVGLFANRNHTATFLACLFPLLAAYVLTSTTVEGRMRRRIFAYAFTIMSIPIILIIGSRTGLLLSIIGIIGGALLLLCKKDSPSGKSSHALPKVWQSKAAISIICGIGLFMLGATTFALSRAEALERIFNSSVVDEGRMQFWDISIDLFFKYLPLGSGPGSFRVAYELVEPGQALNPYYLNHAHNDWLEILTDYGILGMIFLSTIILVYFIRLWKIWFRADGHHSSVLVARAGGMAIALIAAASTTDYPLRTEALMGFLIVCILWFGETEHGRNFEKKDIR